MTLLEYRALSFKVTFIGIAVGFILFLPNFMGYELFGAIGFWIGFLSVVSGMIIRLVSLILIK